MKKVKESKDLNLDWRDIRVDIMPKMTVDFFTEGSNFESAKEYKIGEKIGSGLIGQVFVGLHKKLDQREKCF